MEKYVIFVLCVILSSTVAPPPNTSKQYRNDYVYNRKTDAFYKLHIETVRHWQVSKLCEVEGAELMIPASDYDIIQVHSMFKQYPDIGDYVWVGDDGQKHDSAEEQPIIDLGPAGVETEDIGQCDVVTRNGDIETATCFRDLPFICKVAAKDAPYDQHCKVYGKDYKYYSSVGSCYKIPRIPYTWSQAYSECQAEDAHLLVLNSEAEHEAILNLTNTEWKVIGSKAYYFFFAGFRADKPTGNDTPVFRTIFNLQIFKPKSFHLNGDIETVVCYRRLPFICKVAARDAPYDPHCKVYGKDQTLEEAGYSVWSENEPNNALGQEFCGSVFMNDGKLNDVDCTHEYGFICEKEVPSSS